MLKIADNEIEYPISLWVKKNILENSNKPIWIELPSIEQRTKINTQTKETIADKNITSESHLYQYRK